MSEAHQQLHKLVTQLPARENDPLLDEHQVQLLEPVSDPLTKALTRATKSLLERQAASGCWHFPLEADVTIPAEYLLLRYFLDDVEPAREQRIACYLRRKQMANGAWSLFACGPGNISATVKAYFALKLTGEDVDSDVMRKARSWIRANGGAEAANVFTRITLAVFGQIPWRTVPAMPVEIVFLPSWWFFNLGKVSYWSRCVIMPLLILFARRPVVNLSRDQGITELFLTDPTSLRHIERFSRDRGFVKNAFIALDRLLKIADRMVPSWIRTRAVQRAASWLRDHMQGTGGVGGIYPAMANAVTAMRSLGVSASDPDVARNIQAIEDLVIDGSDETYVQPCLSPVWDTCLALTATIESGAALDSPPVRQAVSWLFEHQVFESGDWADQIPDVAPGGWCFQFENAKYPDVDDTGMVLMSLLRARAHLDPQHGSEWRQCMRRAIDWVLGMQNSNGGWGAFDVDNNREYLNNIPFADHGALVDPSTADVTARSVELLTMLGYDAGFPPLARALAFLRHDQLACGAWYGRWGVNYIYGTWSVLSAVGLLGGDEIAKPYVRKAVEWLRDIQHEDGGWGEACDSYDDPVLMGKGASTPSQTAWAMLALMAAGETECASLQRGVDYLLRTQNGQGEWKEEEYTGTGFPRVFYLRYHGYAQIFPLWALATYAKVRRGLPTKQLEIIAERPIDLIAP